MSRTGAVLGAAIELIPAAVRWIHARIESGEKPEDIRRDIQDRTDVIEANRAKRDAEFEDKFGRPVEEDS
ncbi:MAG: hypothetical protein AAF411_29615 [Myxococcota bacterium]